MGTEAGRLALHDAGIPVINGNNNCSTGSIALFLARQVKDAQIALQHNLGLGGACVVTLYRLIAVNNLKGASS